MRGGFRTLVNPPTPVSEIDVEGTREEREKVHALMRERESITGDVELALYLFNRRVTLGL